tara:strand:- start:189 stop:380 length:192 start_codon:yes stop_codon:yes gene_type:complete
MKNKLGAYIRRRKHTQYVESFVTQLRGKIASQAIMYGNVDKRTRDLFLKYNSYLIELRKKDAN